MERYRYSVSYSSFTEAGIHYHFLNGFSLSVHRAKLVLRCKDNTPAYWVPLNLMIVGIWEWWLEIRLEAYGTALLHWKEKFCTTTITLPYQDDTVQWSVVNLAYLYGSPEGLEGLSCIRGASENWLQVFLLFSFFPVSAFLAWSLPILFS